MAAPLHSPAHDVDLQGERAGLIDVDFDLECMDRIASDPDWLTRSTNSEIMRRAGTEGIETIMWLRERRGRGRAHPGRWKAKTAAPFPRPCVARRRICGLWPWGAT